MKIVTVNVPEGYVTAIAKLVNGKNSLYPSRSELIRVAVREYLLKQLQMAEDYTRFSEVKTQKIEPEPEFDGEHFVRVPVERLNEDNEPVREFRTYKIVKRLEY